MFGRVMKLDGGFILLYTHLLVYLVVTLNMRGVIQ